MMEKITKDHYVDVRGWSEEDIKQAAEVMAEHIGCNVDYDDLVPLGNAYLLKYSEGDSVWTGVDMPYNPIKLRWADFFGEGGYCSNKESGGDGYLSRMDIIKDSVTSIPWNEMPKDATVWIIDLRKGRHDQSGWYRNDGDFWKAIHGNNSFLSDNEGDGMIDVRYPPKEINPNRKPSQANKSTQELELSINFNDGVVIILKGSDEDRLKRIARYLID